MAATRPIDTKRLRLFATVAETLHFGRAADRLGMTQPPLTAQIKRLEEELGTPLFVRSSRRVALTPAGAALHAEARRILADLDRAAALARLTGEGRAGPLRLGFVSTADYSLLPPLLRRFRETYPEIELVLREMTTDAQLHAFASHRLDVGLLVAPPPLDGLETAPLIDESLLVAIPEDHALAAGTGAVDIARLAGMPFVSFERDTAPAFYDLVMAFARSSGLRPRIVQSAVQMQTIIGLVSAGLGLAIVPACMRNLRRRGVVYRPVTPEPPPFRTAIAWPTVGAPPSAARFVEMARAAARAWTAADG